jgi:hypothetical protein
MGLLAVEKLDGIFLGSLFYEAKLSILEQEESWRMRRTL